MALYTPAALGLLKPEDVAALLVQPVQKASVATTVSTTVHTASHDYRIPVLVSDPGTGWAAEGAELAVADPDLDELVVTPKKVGGITIVSSELAEDSDPAAAQVVGDGLARDIAAKLDAAFFGALSAPAPAGLGALAGVTTVEYPDGGFTDLDPVAAALSAAEEVGSTLGALVTTPAMALSLATLKDATDSNRPLLGDDPTRPTGRTALGLPIYSSPAVAAGVVWGVPKDRVFVAIRRDAKIDVSDQAFFSSDRVAVRATMRVGFGFPHPAAIVKMVEAAP